MSNEEKVQESVEAGSSEQIIGNVVDPNKLGGDTGQSTQKQEPSTSGEGTESPKTVPQEQYDNLETKLGEMGEKMGEYTSFYEEIYPLLSKLKDDPELADAIVNGKISSELIKPVLEGTVTQKKAETISEAHKEVKEELGNKKYKDAPSVDIEKLVADKVKDVETKFQKNINEIESNRAFETKVNSFVANTPDFQDYSKDIDKWFDSHPEQYDVEIAYHTVKGAKLAAEAEANKVKADGETAKNVAANASGGASQGVTIVKDENVADQLIANVGDPNVF